MKKHSFLLRFSNGPLDGLALSSDWSSADERAQTVHWRRSQLAWKYHSRLQEGVRRISVNLSETPELPLEKQGNGCKEQQNVDHVYGLNSRSLITGVEVFRLAHHGMQAAQAKSKRNNRKSDRYATNARARVRRLEGVDVQGTLRDISGGGLCLALAAPLRLSERVLVNLVNLEMYLCIPATVVHVAQKSHTGSCLAGLACRPGMSPVNREKLEQWQASLRDSRSMDAFTQRQPVDEPSIALHRSVERR